MTRVTNPTRDDLWCPFCGHQGMRKTPDPAQSGRARYRCGGCGKRTTKPSYAPVQVLPKTKVGEIKKHKFFVVTSAVNDTPIVTRAFETFRCAAESNDGCFLVIPTVYKNPDMYDHGVGGAMRWPDAIMPHLCNANVKLNKAITIKGETQINHCRINPLMGLNHAGSEESEVYAHAQVAMQMLATPKKNLPKMLHTTGTISRENYGGSVTAQKAKFHHSISALIIEIEGDKFWTRQLHFDGDGAYDLDRYYTPDGYTTGHRAAGIVYGDAHIQALDKRVKRVLDGVSTALNPEHEVYHDMHDQHTGSHHSEGDIAFCLSLAKRGRLSIRDELMMSVDYLNEHPGAYVVDSNHHRHLNQWFNRYKPKNDLVNLDLYYELGELLRNDDGDGNLFRLFVERYASVNVNFVDGNDRFLIRNIDCSQHGDRGANGARGSARGFAQSGTKTIVGHSHTPQIEKGCYVVGVMSPDLDYAKGLSSWCNTHALIYDNGKRALFNIIDNKLSPSMRKLVC